jgi:proteasome lid subunit RPN8/RPN11
VKITQQVVAGMIAHARDESPRECCGLLAGDSGLIDEWVRTRNVRASAVAYEIDPGEHISVRKSLRARGRLVLGAYHSHPRTAAVPSGTDVAEAYYDRDFLYVIVSLEREPPDVRAYQVDRGALIETVFERIG